MLEKDISSAIFAGQGTVNKAQTRVPFFSAKIAEEVVSFLRKNRAQSRPVALTTEMPLSPSLERVFASAKVVQSRAKYGQIEPLHLLAAMLAEASDPRVRLLLQSSGITTERVLLALSGDTEN